MRLTFHRCALAAFAAALALAACAPRPAPETWAQPTSAEPQYGGELNIATLYYTLSALSFDPADWTWKSNHDTGAVREQLFAADLSKARSRGGPHPFIADAYLPPDATRGELAESWWWEDDLTLVVRLREGVMWPAVEGLMEQRPLIADDVVFTFEYTAASPKRLLSIIEPFERVEARDDRTVVFRFRYFVSDWQYLFGYGYYSGILPRELSRAEPSDWRTVTGTGPFRITRYIPGHVQTFERNPDYWDVEQVAGADRRLPYLDAMHYRIVQDEATVLSALRTGQLDIVETVRWLMVEPLKSSTPELQWNRWLVPQGTYIALRTDVPPFDDERVRRALNMAVNKREIVEKYYGGNAEMMAFPQHPDFGAVFEPLEEMPENVRELFEYNPEKARALLAEAGVAEGLRVEIEVCSCTGDHLEMLPLILNDWAAVGVRAEIVPREYSVFLSDMSNKQLTSAYMMNTGHVHPVASLRKNFGTGQLWNPSRWSDPVFDEKLSRAQRTRDEAERVAIVRELTREILAKAPYIWLPTRYDYTAWWPWVRNYGGELRAGAVRPGPIYARIWIDHGMKKKMGFE